MTLSFEKRKQAFIDTGKELKRVIEADDNTPLSPAGEILYKNIIESATENPWYTTGNVKNALDGICSMLDSESIERWLSAYTFKQVDDLKTVAVVMAGNIPVVGFHDMMCVLISGNRFLGKLSSQDKRLPVSLANLIIEIQPSFNEFISFSDHLIKDFDAVIATGSNNSARYFDYYFGKYPHIIRKNRSSIAILTGDESPEQLQLLSDDIFMYYGMGCRNVSKIFVPKGYNFSLLPGPFSKWEELKYHHKYFNNYEYQKAVLLVNSIPHLDTGFALLVKDARLSSPLSVVFYDEYDSPKQVYDYVVDNISILQCIVIAPGFGMELPSAVTFGQSQRPGPADYADGIDTMAFLQQL